MKNNRFLDHTPSKIAAILEKNRVIAELFYKRWGILPSDFEAKIRTNELHGGFESKLLSIKNLPIHNSDTITVIGPEIGIEAFMFAELAYRVYIYDPDSTILELIKKISNHYTCYDGTLAKDKFAYFHAGFRINKVNLKDKQQYESVQKILNHALPTYYNVDSLQEIQDVLIESDTIFIHKILTTLTRFCSDSSSEDIATYIIRILKNRSKKNTIISWTEPDFVWKKFFLNYPNTLLDTSTTKKRMIAYPLSQCTDTYVQYIL